MEPVRQPTAPPSSKRKRSLHDTNHDDEEDVQPTVKTTRGTEKVHESFRESDEGKEIAAVSGNRIVGERLRVSKYELIRAFFGFIYRQR